MGLLGKYTTYVGGMASDAHKLLVKLFPNNPFAVPLTQGDEVAAQKLVIAVATANVDANGVGGLQPANGQQTGDLGMFPTGVDMSFGGSPDVSTVKWTNPGDPANPYTPDISSPPDGGTDGLDKNVDPQFSVADAQAIATDEDTRGDDLRNPASDGPAVYKNNAIGAPQKMGDSGGNV
jgi:hypothetical protein